VSLLSRKHYRLGLGASYAILSEVQGGCLKSWRIKTWQRDESDGWRNSLELAISWVIELKLRDASLRVFLSAELAQLQLLPWRDDATTSAQQHLLALAMLKNIHGEMASMLDVMVWPSGYNCPWLAASVEHDLIVSIKDDFLAIGTKVVNIQPLAISLFNSSRSMLNGLNPSWLLIPEHQLITAMHWCDDQWQVIQTFPKYNLKRESLLRLLQREARLAGIDDAHSSFYSFGNIDQELQYKQLTVGWKKESSSEHIFQHLVGGLK
jgi:hypothetical protein